MDPSFSFILTSHTCTCMRKWSIKTAAYIHCYSHITHITREWESGSQVLAFTLTWAPSLSCLITYIRVHGNMDLLDSSALCNLSHSHIIIGITHLAHSYESDAFIFGCLYSLSLSLSFIVLSS